MTREKKPLGYCVWNYPYEKWSSPLSGKAISKKEMDKWVATFKKLLSEEPETFYTQSPDQIFDGVLP